jgi:hypothetical protein
MVESMLQDTLGRYPYPIVRIACRYCRRRGQYRLEHLVRKYGANADLVDVLRNISADCALAGNRTSRRGCLGAYLPDLGRKR